MKNERPESQQIFTNTMQLKQEERELLQIYMETYKGDYDTFFSYQLIPALTTWGLFHVSILST